MTTATAGHGKDIRLGAVAAQAGREHAPSAFAALEHRSSGPVAEEHAGVAVGPVDDGGQFFGADNQYVLINATGNKGAAHFEGIDKSGTSRFQIKRGGLGGAQFLLYQTGGGGEGHVGRDGGHDNEIEIGRF